MLVRFLNLKTILATIAICIVSGTIFYSQYIARKIAAEETRKIEQWAEAVKNNSNPNVTISNLTTKVLSENSVDIPILLVTENHELLDHRNIDTIGLYNTQNFVQQKINDLKKYHDPIVWKNPLDSTQINKVFYGESKLLKEVRYYPIIQLIIVILFIIIVLIALQTSYRSTQNQVWAGLAKETAHQLGTPVSSLEGWLEMLKDIKGNESIVPEMEKDVNRLLLISDRFGKIGSTPHLEKKNIVEQILTMMEYIKKRAGHHVKFNLQSKEKEIFALISPPLFDWVIENLLKNALDAMEGKGNINIAIKEEHQKIEIEINDDGKGISSRNISKVFKPGFTTKKRGWGLGLTLTKRIVEQFHKGKIFIKHSEIGKGTTFKIELNSISY
ncbi:MAG: HAMP domain-containing histidine kinase [Chitinophagaceae bacterium]|nr:HAMP domain-containing histidine kinase [Chitinophagaceae bacterium]